MTDAHPSALLVDDDPLTLRAMERRFRDRGYFTTTCKNGTSAAESMRGRRFDVIVLDVMMPGMSGLDVLAGKPASPNAGTPVFLLTSMAQDEIAERGKELGAKAVLRKTEYTITEAAATILRNLAPSA